MASEARVTMNVDVPRAAQQSLRDYCERHGLIQRHLMGVLIENFLGAHDVVKRILRGDVDEPMRMAYADALDQLARELRGVSGPVLPYADITPKPEPKSPPGSGPAEPRNGRKRRAVP